MIAEEMRTSQFHKREINARMGSREIVTRIVEERHAHAQIERLRALAF